MTSEESPVVLHMDMRRDGTIDVEYLDSRVGRAAVAGMLRHLAEHFDESRAGHCPARLINTIRMR